MTVRVMRDLFKKNNNNNKFSIKYPNGRTCHTEFNSKSFNFVWNIKRPYASSYI